MQILDPHAPSEKVRVPPYRWVRVLAVNADVEDEMIRCHAFCTEQGAAGWLIVIYEHAVENIQGQDRLVAYCRRQIALPPGTRFDIVEEQIPETGKLN